jgi:hypothetical protein
MTTRTTARKDSTKTTYWPAVQLTDLAESRAQELTILHQGFPGAFRTAVVGLLEDFRNGAPNDGKVQVADLMPDRDLPIGIRLSYRRTESSLLVCDIYIPSQPTLF